MSTKPTPNILDQLSDADLAQRVRMLGRSDLDFEPVLMAARDRILKLSASTQPTSEARAEIEPGTLTNSEGERIAIEKRTLRGREVRCLVIYDDAPPNGTGQPAPMLLDDQLRDWLLDKLTVPHPAAPADAGDAMRRERDTAIASERQMREQVNAKYWEQIREDNRNLNHQLRAKEAELAAARRLLDAPPGVGERMREALVSVRTALSIDNNYGGTWGPEISEIDAALAAPAPAEAARAKIGPFLCEWCSTPLDTLKGTRKFQDNPNLITGVGACPRCRCEVWSKPVALAASSAAEGGTTDTEG